MQGQLELFTWEGGWDVRVCVLAKCAHGGRV